MDCQPELYENRLKIAREYDPTNPGPRHFEIWDVDTWVRAYFTNPFTRYCHELQIPSQPAAFLMDLELPTTEIRSLKDWNDQILYPAIAEVLKDFPNHPEPIIWDDHVQEKYSTHVYFDIWFDTAAASGRYGRKLKGRLTGQLAAAIDPMWVLTVTSGIKQLRMPLSGKQGRPDRRLKPHRKPENQDQLKEWVVRSITTCYRKPGDVFPENSWANKLCLVEQFYTMPEEEDPDIGFGHISVADIGEIWSPREIDNIKAWLREVHGVRKIKRYGDNCFQLSPGCYCPKKGRSHLSNTTFITFKRDRTAFFTCMDAECRFVYDIGGNLVYLANPGRRLTFFMEDMIAEAYLAKAQTFDD